MILCLPAVAVPADALPPPMFPYDVTVADQAGADQSAASFEAFLFYLAEFEDDRGEWAEVMSVQQDAGAGGQTHE